MKWRKVLSKGEIKRVETSAVEFDWIFRDRNAKKFMEHLAFFANDSIFEADITRVIVQFLW